MFNCQEVNGNCLELHSSRECLSMENSTFKQVQSNISWIGPIAMTGSAGNQIRINYAFILSTIKCCPGLVVLTEPLPNFIIANGCLDMSPHLLEILYPINEYYYLSIDWNKKEKDERKFRTCQNLDSDNLYSCYGHMDIILSEPKVASLYIFYPCDGRQKIDMMTDISFVVKNLSFPCQRLEAGDTCFKYYNSFHRPGLLGLKDYHTAVSLISSASPFIPPGCHQHIEEFICHTILPECTSEGYKLPCRNMCTEMMLSPCADLLHLFIPSFHLNQKDYQIIMELACREFPMNQPCFTKNINCSVPPEIDNGALKYDIVEHTIHSIATYSCDENYKIDGNSSVNCQYSGQWSEPPKCVLVPNKISEIILSSSFGVFALIIIVVVFILTKYRKEIVVILYAKFGLRFFKAKEEDKHYDAFVAYSHEDIAFVKHELLAFLEDKDFKICLKDRDFEIGGWRANNVISSIQDSKRAIIVLSQSFIEDEWCQFEFDRAHHQLLNASFKLLIVSLEKPQNLGSIPDLIASYINTGEYLFRHDKSFWKKILDFMPERENHNDLLPERENENHLMAERKNENHFEPERENQNSGDETPV